MDGHTTDDPARRDSPFDGPAAGQTGSVAVQDDAPSAPEPEATQPTEEPDRLRKKPKRRKKSREKTGPPAEGAPPLGSAKAVETMFRNAIRSELDMIALAATKANIMISLNGFIISALMISGAFLFNSSPSFLVPAAVFMLTSAGSIVFALFAASPDQGSLVGGVRSWWTRLRGREPVTEDHEKNLLIYEDRVQLDQDAYWAQMQDLLRDRDEIYHQMSQHLYWLGEMTARKFKLLNISYAVFRWGLLASILTFLLVKASLWAVPIVLGTQEKGGVANMGIAEFTDVYEPSAVQQLPDGRILVVEDEPSRAMNLLTIGEDGLLVEDSAADLRLTRSFGRSLNDLEGLSIDGDHVYAITSHAGDAEGVRHPDREQLLRFEIRGSQAGNIAAYSGLRDALKDDTELQATLTALSGGEPVDFGELNIEGLAFHRGQLLLGLRDPGVVDHSLVVPIQNPDEVFAGNHPKFGKPIALNLEGGGIRALSYDPVLGAFLIVNEIEDASGDKVSQMWRWTGDAELAPEPLSLPNLINLNNVESIDSVTIGGEQRLLIMSDDGDPKENIPAKYLVLDYDQLPAQGEPVPSEPPAAPNPTGTAPAPTAATPDAPAPDAG